MSAVDRFLAKVASDGDCSVWTSATFPPTPSGRYGAFWHDGRTRRAHRVAYEMFVGQVPEGLVLDHLCRNTLCVNPAHLEPVTRRENILRGFSPLAANARKTHCPKGHAYDEANTYVYRGQRSCRECNRLAKVSERTAPAADSQTQEAAQ